MPWVRMPESPKEEPMETKEKKTSKPRRRTSAVKRPDTAKRRPTPQRRTRQPQRRVKAPREDIPEAVYTMPQPLRKGKFLLRLVSVVAVVLSMVIAMSIFFRVDTVTVLGAEKYTPWMVREASGIEDGDGLLTLSKARAAGKIKSALPYVDQVKIIRQLPSTVQIEITELAVTYAIAAEDATWWLIDSDGEAVEPIEASAAIGYTRIAGLTIQTPRQGQSVTAAEAQTETEESTEASGDGITIPTQPAETNAQRLAAALSILKSLEDNGAIGQVASINVLSLTDLELQYGQRFQVKLGSSDRISYKITYMTQMISQLEDHQTGVLDVSFEFSEQGIFTPDS